MPSARPCGPALASAAWSSLTAEHVPDLLSGVTLAATDAGLDGRLHELLAREARVCFSGFDHLPDPERGPNQRTGAVARQGVAHRVDQTAETGTGSTGTRIRARTGGCSRWAWH